MVSEPTIVIDSPRMIVVTYMCAKTIVNNYSIYIYIMIETYGHTYGFNMFKLIIDLILNGISRAISRTIGVISHLLSRMKHQAG